MAAEAGCRLLHWRPAVAPEAPGGVRYDAALLDALMGSSSPALAPKMLLLACPHTPTGWTPAAGEMEAIVEVCRRHGSFLVCDERLRLLDRAPGLHAASVAQLYEGAICVGGLGEAFGLPGLAVGWLASQNAAVLARAAQQQAYTAGPGSGVSQLFALAALRGARGLLEGARATVASLKNTR